jgi:hypothetical protein
MKLKLSSFSLKITLVIVFLFFLTKSNAQATIASWTYDSLLPNTTNPTPDVGTGSSSLVGITAAPQSFKGLNSTTGCGKDNLGKAWSLEYFNPGSSNPGNGVEYKVSTVGYTNIKLSWDQHFTNTAPNTVRLQYTTNNGTTWTNFTMVNGTNTTICAGSINVNGCFETNTGDYYRRIIVDFSSITAINNNANFGIRLLASYYQSSGQYRQSNTPTSIATSSGNWRFDNVNFTGTPTTTGAVISGTSTVCAGGTGNIKVTINGGTPNYTVVYSPDGGTTQITKTNYLSGSNISVSPTTTTTYTLVSVKDNGNNPITPISGAAVITVNAGVVPSFITAPGSSTCDGSSVTYSTQTGMDSYVWTLPAGLTSPTDYTITSGALSGVNATDTLVLTWNIVSGNAMRTGTVNYTSGGCTASTPASSTTTVYALPAIAPSISSPSTLLCVGTSFIYNTNTSYSNYTWYFYNGNDNTFPSANIGTDYTVVYSNSNATATVTWLTSGPKTVNVNYSNFPTPNCQALSFGSLTKTFNSPPTVSISPSASQTICVGGTFTTMTATATGTGLTYQWVKVAGGTPMLGATNATFTPPSTRGTNTANNTGNATGGYIVRVTSGNCSVSSTATGPFTINSPSVGGTAMYAGSSGTIPCPNNPPTANISLTGNTGSTIQWQSSTTSSSAGFSTISGATTTTLTPTQVGAMPSTTYIRASVTSGVCTAAYSTVITIPIGKQWNGTTSTDWGADANWTPNGVPTSSDCIVIPSGTTNSPVITATSFANNLTINSGASLTVNAGVALEVQDFVKTDGTLTLNNNSSLVQVNNVTNSGSGAMVYKRDVGTVLNPLHGYDYVYWSSPVASQSIDNLYSTPSMGYKYYWNTLVDNYNGTGGNTCQGNWAVASGNMSIGKGYIVRASNSYGWTGTLTSIFTGIPNNGTLPVPIARGLYQGGGYSGVNGVSIDKTEDNLNLIGNPYPSAIKAIDFLNANTTIEGNVCLWTHTSSPESSVNPFYSTLTYTTNYATMDYITYNSSGSSLGPATFNGYIAAGQGFFVSMVDGPADATQSVTFTNTMRKKEYGNSQFFKTGQISSTPENDKHSIWIDLLDGTNTISRALVAYCEGATHQKDRMFDAYTRVADATILYSLIGSESQIIQGRGLPFDENDQVPLGYHAPTAGSFTIAIAAVDGLFAQGQSIYLEDKLLHITFNLRQAPYVFTTDQGTFNDRFVLRYTDTSLSNSDFSALSASFVVFKSHDVITIQSDATQIGEVVVYDIQGRILNDFKNLATSEFQFSAPSAQQVLVLKIITKDNLSFYRKILN